MISNEERRNLASSLRHDASYGEGSLSEWWARLQFIVLDEDDFPNPSEVFERLADLIDRPICHDTNGVRVFNDCFACSECGSWFNTWDDNGGWATVCYCPNCGAEVVSDED